MTAIEKITSLKIGSKISRNGKTYEVKNITKVSEKIYRHIVAVLEVGLPETYTRNGVGIAAGKVFEFSNIHTIEVSTQLNQNNWELIA